MTKVVTCIRFLTVPGNIRSHTKKIGKYCLLIFSKSVSPASSGAFCLGKNNFESWCQNVRGNGAFWCYYLAIHACCDSLISPSDG